MAKGGSGIAKKWRLLMPKDAPVNTGASPDTDIDGDAVMVSAFGRVSGIQAKLHRWAVADAGRRFDDLFNLVCDPATLLVAWDRVASNKGARTAGSDGKTVTAIRTDPGVPEFLHDLRAGLKDGSFRPQPVRERRIPKPGGSGKLRRLGIPTDLANREVPKAA
jgi:RNA-directed DNA polymerase